MIKRTIASLLAAVIVVSCSAGAFQQVGYFKNATGHRVFTIVFEPGTPEFEIRAYAERLPNTPGRMTAAYFYRRGSTVPDPTLARDLEAAIDLIFKTASHEYAFVRNLDPPGTITFVNCRENPAHELCRADAP